MEILIAFIIGAILWRLGGWGGWLGKTPRRYILPFILTLYAISKKRKWQVGLLFPILIGMFSLGYGEKYPYWAKFLVGCAWVIPRFFFLGFHWFPILVPFIWLGLFWLSNKKPFSNIFKWQFVEIIVGGLIGISYVV